MFGLNASVFDLGWIIFGAIISCVSYTFSGTFLDQDHCDETEWLPLDWKVFVIFFLLIVVFKSFQRWVSQFASFILTPSCLYFFFFTSDSECRRCVDYPPGKVSERANRRRKGKRPPTHAISDWTAKTFHAFWHSRLSSSTHSSPPQYWNH